MRLKVICSNIAVKLALKYKIFKYYLFLNIKTLNLVF